MVLIPPDVAIRMRMQTEANLLESVQPVRGVPSDLPELQTGQTFSARIQDALPDNTYRALVAGRQFTLQLPEGAKAGDQLELVVIDRSARAIIARRTDAPAVPAEEAAPYAFTRFSPAARLIGQLLPATGEAAPSASLTRGQPLLAAAPALSSPAASPAPATELATALGKAVVHSGVFYEAHQAEWVRGERPLAQLLQEPQGQHSSPTVLSRSDNSPVPLAPRESSAATAGPEPGRPATSLATAIPDALRPLVQQQLEAAASNRVLWHGEVWPNQSMDWSIEWDERGGGGDAAGEESPWRTTLSLTTPRLGRVDARLQLTRQGVGIALVASADTSAEDLRAGLPHLVKALEAAGVPLTGFSVHHENEHVAGQG